MDWISEAKRQTINLAKYDDPANMLSEGAVWVILEIAKQFGDEAQFATVLTALREMHMGGKFTRRPLEEALDALQESAIMDALNNTDLSKQDSIELAKLIKKHHEKIHSSGGETPPYEQIVAISYEIGPQLLKEVFGDQ